MALVGVGLLILRGCQSQMFYHPDKSLAVTPADVGLAFEPVTLTTSDEVALAAWFVPGDSEQAVLLLCHGNAGNIGNRVGWVKLMNAMGFSVLAFDYRGYGLSGGKPNEVGTYRDAEAAWTYLVEQRGVDPSRIVLVGRSMGGAIATHLATERPAAALILEAAFTSYPDIAQDKAGIFPVRWMAAFDYSTIESLAAVQCPVLIMHSPADTVVGYHHGEALFEAANPPKTFLELTGGHNDAFVRSGDAYTHGIRAFVQAAVPDAVIDASPVAASE